MTRTSLALISLIVLAVSCAAPVPRGRAAGVRAAASAASGDAAAVAPAPSRRLKQRPSSVVMRVPQRGITTPMRGEPASAVLASETRLESSTCENVTTEHVEARLKEMRAAVKASFQTWHDGQPACWEEMRREHAWRKEMERLQRSGGSGGRFSRCSPPSGTIGS